MATEDILKSVREEILKEDEKYLPWVPMHLDKTWEVQAGIAGAIAGFLTGASIGAHMGIAGAWGAIAGTVPCAIVGGVIGYLSGAKVGSRVQREPRLHAGSAGWQTPRESTLTGASPEQVGELPEGSASQCAYCGAARSVWWDNRRDCCGRCSRSA